MTLRKKVFFEIIFFLLNSFLIFLPPAITEIESKSEKKRNRFSVQTEPPRSPSPRPSDPSQAPVVPPPRPKRPGVVPQVLRVYLDDGDPFILKAGFPLSFSVRLDDKMKAPQLRYFFSFHVCFIHFVSYFLYIYIYFFQTKNETIIIESECTKKSCTIHQKI